MSVNGLRALPRTLVRRRIEERAADLTFSRGLHRVLAVEHIATWEFGVAVGALFVLGRSNVLFFRQRFASVFGGRAGPLWQDDVVLQVVFGIAMVSVLAVALRRARPSALLRQPLLLAFIGLAWLSLMWSVEPGISVRRVLLFLGTVLIGWYLGDRFPPRSQLSIVVGVAYAGVFGTLIGLVFWNLIVRQTGGTLGHWSGIYVNRNLLGLVMSYGLMALIFKASSTSRRWSLYVLGTIMSLVLFLTRSRSGPVSLAGALSVAAAVWLFRHQGARRLSAAKGAYVTFATLGTIGLFVHYYWVEILEWLGRDPSMSRRTHIWEVDRFFANQRPWTGWGFEALWTNPRAIDQAYNATGRYPYSAHNGYYEVLLSVGRVGLLLFAGFLAVSLWRSFRYAWERTDVASLWPLTFLVFAVIMNFSESLFLSSEAVMALTVAAAVAVTEWPRREDEPGRRPLT